MKHEFYVELRDGKDRPVGFMVTVDPAKCMLALSVRARKSGKATALRDGVIVRTVPVRIAVPGLLPMPPTVPRAFTVGPRSAADVPPEPAADTLYRSGASIGSGFVGVKALAQTKLERAQNRDQDRDDAKVSAGTTKGRQRPGKPVKIDPDPVIPYRWPSPADFADKEHPTGRGWPKPGDDAKGKY